ncbi:amidohydrolase [Peristeroidobacter agariperforans]|uniref:amidohydrolase n=1 Tax=Peristeroidobacter agariperforans TaxID=268404 RepID=UPI00101CFDE0|nr:amidohydrolase [Peristeroidobacter agariperforans]
MRAPFKTQLAACICATLTFASTALGADMADKVYLNGRIWTGGSTGELSQAIAIEGERLVAVGPTATIKSRIGPKTEVVELNGAFVTPGFIDAHVHFIEGGISLGHVDLRDAKTPQEFASRIAAAARQKPPGEWVLYGAWDHEMWGGELPDRNWIDKETSNTPVYVTRLDGHMALANSLALKLAGIDEKTPDPPGGTIVRDAKGRPTGVLKDEAQSLMKIPEESMDQVDRALQTAMTHAASRGVTQVHDMAMGTWRSLEAYRRARDRDALRVRIYSFVPLADWQRMAEYVRTHGRGDDWLRWGGLKGYVDGSLGSTTAWFHQPYTDDPKTSGLILVAPDEQRRRIVNADRAGLHVVIHAIGDRANDWLLDTYKSVAAENGPRDRRFRIEHAQHLSPTAAAQFASQGVIASMQPYHAIDDGRWAEKRIGPERLKGTYAFRSLLDAKALLAFGSDWPVAPLDPLEGIYAAVTRRTIDGANPDGWQPQQKITVEEAVRAYTQADAYAGYQEKSVGKLEPGYLADFVVLSANLFETEPVNIPKLEVLRTVVGGRAVFIKQGE